MLLDTDTTLASLFHTMQQRQSRNNASQSGPISADRVTNFKDFLDKLLSILMRREILLLRFAGGSTCALQQLRKGNDVVARISKKAAKTISRISEHIVSLREKVSSIRTIFTATLDRVERSQTASEEYTMLLSEQVAVTAKELDECRVNYANEKKQRDLTISEKGKEIQEALAQLQQERSNYVVLREEFDASERRAQLLANESAAREKALEETVKALEKQIREESSEKEKLTKDLVQSRLKVREAEEGIACATRVAHQARTEADLRITALSREKFEILSEKECVTTKLAEVMTEKDAVEKKMHAAAIDKEQAVSGKNEAVKINAQLEADKARLSNENAALKDQLESVSKAHAKQLQSMILDVKTSKNADRDIHKPPQGAAGPLNKIYTTQQLAKNRKQSELLTETTPEDIKRPGSRKEPEAQATSTVCEPPEVASKAKRRASAKSPQKTPRAKRIKVKTTKTLPVPSKRSTTPNAKKSKSGRNHKRKASRYDMSDDDDDDDWVVDMTRNDKPLGK